MASSSSTSRSWSYDVFPSFRGEDVRKSFLSYLLKELHRKSIHTFIDNGIERSRTIAPELLLAIEGSRISIVVFSRNYVSSTWCLNELVHIHKCWREMSQMVIPIFYDVDPSHVRNQTGEFGKAFDDTCKGKAEDDKERWIRALVEVANMAGYDLQNWDNEANMTETIATDVSNKLNNITPSDDFAEFVGIEAHIEKLNSMLCLESGGVRMVGIVGTSGVGKSTIARALYNKLSSQFDLRSLKPYKRTLQDRKIADINVKLNWAKLFMSDILCQNGVEIDSLSVVEQRLKHKKVLIILDDVDERELLETLVGQPEWFGVGSRIIVVTQDRELLKFHKINLIYDVELPSEDLALQMLCRSAFGQNSPLDGFKEIAYEVVKLSGKLPLGVNVLGSTLSEKSKKEWMEMLPRLRDGLDGKIERTLRVSYDGLDRKDQDIFLHIACLFNGEKVKHIKNMLGTDALRILADRSLISIRPPSTRKSIWSSTGSETVEMHGLLEKLGREIVRAEFRDNLEKRRFLMDAKDILDVLTDHDTGTKTVGIYFDISKMKEPLFIDEKSFQGMRNLQYINFFEEYWVAGEVKFVLPQGHVIYLPPKLRLLHWDKYPAKSLPCSFRGEYLVELIMRNGKLEKLWEGTQPVGNLELINLSGCENLREIPDLSKATNLKKLNLRGCLSLKVLPRNIDLVSLSSLDLRGCSQLKSFPQLSTGLRSLMLDATAIYEVPSWIQNIAGLTRLSMRYCWKLRKISATIRNLKDGYCFDIYGCERKVKVSNANLIKTLADLHPAGIEHYTQGLTGDYVRTEFLLAPGGQEYILQTAFPFADIPGEQVPTYFTHRDCGASLSVPLPETESSLSNMKLEFAGCIVLDLAVAIHYYAPYIFVHWKFRGVSGICRIIPVRYYPKLDHHQLVFHFDFKNGEEVDDPTSQFDCNNVEFEFEVHDLPLCSCYRLSGMGVRDLETCPFFPQKIKECGIRVWSVSPSLDAETERSSDAESLERKIEKTLRVSYDELEEKDDQAIFLYAVCLFIGESVSYVKNLLENVLYTSVDTRLRRLADKSLICISPLRETVYMDYALQNLGREIVRAESINNPGERRFLVNAEDISKVFKDNTGTGNVLGIRLNTSEIKEPLFTDENSFEGMHNLQFIKLYHDRSRGSRDICEVKFDLAQDHVIHLPRQLRLLHWDEYPAKSLPSSFSAGYLVDLTMEDSMLEKLWEGIQPLQSLKKMKLNGSKCLKEIPDLSYAINLENLELKDCTSLEHLPTNIDLESLDVLDLSGCSRLTSFPQLSKSIKELYLNGTAIEEVPSWIKNMTGLTKLLMRDCKKLRKISARIWDLEHLSDTDFKGDRAVTYADTAFSNVNLEETVAKIHPPSLDYYTKSSQESDPLFFFVLARGAQEYILQAEFKYAVLPGKQVPRWYFPHVNRGSTLSVPLPQSSLSQTDLGFTGCIILDLTDHHQEHVIIFVHWKFRGVSGICLIFPFTGSREMDNHVVFNFHFDKGEEIDDPPSQFDCNNVNFEFEVHNTLEHCSCSSLEGPKDRDHQTCPVSDCKIEECGIRVLSVCPSLDANETEDKQQDGENDAKTERSIKTDENKPNGESDAESERSKKRMKMTVMSSQVPSNPPCGQTVYTVTPSSSNFSSPYANDRSSETEEDS